MTTITRQRPAVSVATIVERDGRFLLVEERTRGGLRLNQPAGHLEAGETLEESAWRVEVTGLVGIYLWQPPDSRRAYLRFSFAATARVQETARALDDGIVRALWMTAAEMRACLARHRTPLVMRCVDDYLAGRRMPLDCIATLGDFA